MTPFALVALLFFGSIAFPAWANPSLEVVNDSGLTLMELYASPPFSETWGQDLLHVRVLPDGETGHYVIEADAEQCEFDLRVIFEDGKERHDVVDVCNQPIYRLEEAR